MPDLYTSPAARFRARLVSLLGMSLVTAALAAMLAMNWRRMPDPILDYGREVYIPWRIQAYGEVLYRDIKSFNGPFSAYVHAGVFQLCKKPFGGASLDAIKAFNALVAWIVGMLIYRLVRAATDGDDLTATVAGLGYALMFAVQQYRGANYNFITPYSYELPHGVALSLGMIYFLWRASRTRSRHIVWTSLAGVMFGLVFLTKAEVFVAAAGAGAVAIICQLRGRAHVTRDALETIGIFLGYAVATVVLGVLLLTLAMTPGEAIGGVLGALKYLGDARLLGLPYFKWLMGTDSVDRSLQQLFLWLGGYLVVFVAPAALGWLLGRLSGERAGAAWWRRRGFGYVSVSVAIVLAGSIAAALLYFTELRPSAQAPEGTWGVIPWPGALRPLPAVMLVAFALLVQMILNRPRAAAAAFTLPAALIVFAGLLLGKIVLNVHAYHYGFALALPAFVVLVTAVVGWIPQGVRRSTGSAAAAWVPRLSALVGVALIVGVHARLGQIEASHRTDQVATAPDAFLVDHARGNGYGPIVDAVVRDVRTQTTRTTTLVCMPEGLMINYLARRANPTGELNFNPASLAMFGEDQILADLKATPPDFVAIVYQDTHVYGVTAFGKDYAQRIWSWVAEEYEPVKVYGSIPYQEPGPGIALMKHKDPRSLGQPSAAPRPAPATATAPATTAPSITSIRP
jgi:hypothetical protein